MGTYKYPKLQTQHVKLAEKIIKICTSWLKQNGIHSFLLSYEKLDKVEISNYSQNDYYIGLFIPR